MTRKTSDYVGFRRGSFEPREVIVLERILDELESENFSVTRAAAASRSADSAATLAPVLAFSTLDLCRGMRQCCIKRGLNQPGHPSLSVYFRLLERSLPLALRESSTTETQVVLAQQTELALHAHCNADLMILRRICFEAILFLKQGGNLLDLHLLMSKFSPFLLRELPWSRRALTGLIPLVIAGRWLCISRTFISPVRSAFAKDPALQLLLDMLCDALHSLALQVFEKTHRPRDADTLQSLRLHFSLPSLF